jgi:pentatricopeptide repeat protein
MTNPPIADYGLIGDCHSAALVSNRGSIDWLCAPRFDSPSLFARILDAGRGGHFAVHPAGEFHSRHEYAGYSGVLKTTFETANGAAVLTDFMPLEIGEEPLPWAKPRAPRRLIRLIEGTRGAVELAIEIAPRPDYGRGEPSLLATARGLQIQGRERLHSPVPLSVSPGTATATTTVRRGEQLALVLELDGNQDAQHAVGLSDCLAQLEKTLAFWDGWCRRCVYRGLYEEAVMRSALTLKLLTYAPTGAMVAAPTSSLPEEIGGVRNWDYRFTWIRDASFGAYALLSAGHIEDAVSFFDWICRVALRCGAGELQILYGLDGEKNLAEYSLDHLEGYRRSRPVRIGNAACEQFQLDVYGELLDCFHAYRRLGELSPERLHDIWPAFRQQVDHVAERWREPDSGIWEMRTEPRQFVYSKVMAWTALDRAIQAAEELQLPADLSRWRSERAAIRSEVLEKGYDPVLGSFTQSYGARVLDAATLLLPMLGFIDPGDERMQSTIEAIERNLMADGLVYRYVGADDGLPGGEATFGACTFWLVDNLVALGRLDEAKELFERMLSRATPLGLFAEEIEPGDSVHLGNFPQALTHIALMNVAVKLARALGGERKRRDST